MSEGRQGVFDAVIVGAGMAGACAATVLARRGLSVALVDRRERCAPVFRAEKVEPDQADKMRALGLFEVVRPKLTPIRSIASGLSGRVLAVSTIEQYGVDYWELVNAVRDAMPREVVGRVEKVEKIETASDRSRVTLGDGSSLDARIVVLSCGTTPALAAGLGLRHREIRRPHSLAFGFDVELQCPPRDFDSLTYYAGNLASGLDYITLFPIGNRWRANLFTYLEPAGSAMRTWLRTPTESIEQGFPKLARLVGRVGVVGRVEAQTIELYQLEGPPRDGLVVIGDAFQSVCPATGTGLSKVLTDVTVLADLLPDWLATPGMDAGRIAAYYADPRKQESDARSLEWAEHRRNFSTRTDLRWRIHRARTWLGLYSQGRRRRPPAQGTM